MWIKRNPVKYLEVKPIASIVQFQSAQKEKKTEAEKKLSASVLEDLFYKNINSLSAL